jgi:N utilization substance protein A
MTDKKIPGKKPPKVPIRISRTREDFIRKLFEREVPEIISGEVVIKSVAREAGNRSKVAVFSTVDGIDPIGSCIGPHNSRMHNILKEIGKEKIDLIPYDEDAEKFVGAALSPAKATAVILNEGEEKSCTVYVPEAQLSLAIGRDGINAKLANRLTGYKLDIKASNGSENMKKPEDEDAAENDSAAETIAEAENTDTSETTDAAETSDAVSAESPEEQE